MCVCVGGRACVHVGVLVTVCSFCATAKAGLENRTSLVCCASRDSRTFSKSYQRSGHQKHMLLKVIIPIHVLPTSVQACEIPCKATLYGSSCRVPCSMKSRDPKADISTPAAAPHFRDRGIFLESASCGKPGEGH